jgi:hypothetical protein
MRRVPYSPPKCTVCSGFATSLSKSGEPRCGRHTAAAAQFKKCNRCGSPMAVRENRRNHSYFWGCTNYPRCLNAENI